MTKYFTYITAMLLVLVGGLNGCKKDAEVTQTSSTGSISGTISPAGAAASINATNLQSNRVYSAITDAATGVFKIASIDTGTYKISFTGTAKFVGPPDVTTTVLAGQNNDLGNVVFQWASITGTISPAGTVIYVLINAQDGTAYGVLLDSATGAFKTGTLPFGNYYISFLAASGYKSPSSSAPIKVTLATGQTNDIGTIVMLPYKLSGAPIISNVPDLNYSAPNLTMGSADGDITNGSRQNFDIIMDNITAPGTYVCKNTATSNITYSSHRWSSYGPTTTWSTTNAGGSGTVVVTSIDPVKKEIKGTFTATLVSSTSNTSNVVINNGSFYFAY